MLNVIMLNVVMLSVIMLNVVILNVIMLSVVAPQKEANIRVEVRLVRCEAYCKVLSITAVKSIIVQTDGGKSFLHILFFSFKSVKKNIKYLNILESLKNNFQTFYQVVKQTGLNLLKQV